jgi:hypothetical protein
VSVDTGADSLATFHDAYGTALRAARRELLTARGHGDIDADALHALEKELDWIEVSDPLRGAAPSPADPAGRLR